MYIYTQHSHFSYKGYFINVGIKDIWNTLPVVFSILYFEDKSGFNHQFEYCEREKEKTSIRSFFITTLHIKQDREICLSDQLTSKNSQFSR